MRATPARATRREWIGMSLGLAPVFTIGNEMIITAAPPERAGAASAISETASEFSGALGIAVFGSAGMAFYRHTLAGALPQGLGALAASASLPAAASAAGPSRWPMKRVEAMAMAPPVYRAATAPHDPRPTRQRHAAPRTHRQLRATARRRHHSLTG